MILNTDGNLYLIARLLQSMQPGGDFNVLMSFNDSGDTLKTKSFVSLYSTGLSNIHSLMNNNDVIDGFYGTATGFSVFSPLQILEIDTNLNINFFEVSNIGGNILQFSSRFTTKWLNESNYLLLNSEKPNNSSTVDIFVAKFNTSHEIVGEPIWVGRPDTSDWVPRYGMDWSDPDNIFVCAYQFVYHVPWEVSQVVALIDSSLNVKGMKYYGEDLNFGIWTLCATSDGGAILPVAHHDYNNPYIDTDLIVWKISANDLITSSAETTNPYDSDYYVYPNPGNDVLNIQTAQKGVSVDIYDDKGNLILKKELQDSYLNQINTSCFVPGNYIYKFTDSRGNTDSGKWMKY
ncbi:MAG: T9SS type A sorting domain-containing protein [Bacteroidales bacterium]